jgi:hypothetical protein
MHSLQCYEAHSSVNDWVHALDIAEVLKQLLIDANITIESIIELSYRELSEILHIDLYGGELIIRAVRKFVYEKNLNQDIA